jgi:glutaconyl-CoA decarboxylase
MRSYFEEMIPFGKPLSDSQKESAKENVAHIMAVEKEVAEAVEAVKNAGIPAEVIKKRGQLTVWERIEYLVDPGTWHPLHTLYNPQFNEEGTTGVVDGLAKIDGKWAVVIGFDNKVMAGAWIAGQADNQLMVTDMAKRLHVPLVWIVNCSGVKLTEQQEVYAGRRGNGATFFRHAELEKLGVPILAGIYGTNPAGGGYQGISPTILLAHKNANIAVGGGGIVGGMSPKGYFDEAGAEQLIEATRHFKQVPPGSVPIHHNETGFFKEVYETEEGVLDALKKYLNMMPAYDPHFFRVAEPKEPKFSGNDINSIVAFNQKRSYNFEEMLARIFDNSEHMEFRPDYGPEVYTGLARIDGFLLAFIGNHHGFLGQNYPEYAPYPGIGGKLYRQGLIKMNEFVTLCGRDRVPIVWFQDTSGIDVGDIAEKNPDNRDLRHAWGDGCGCFVLEATGKRKRCRSSS